MRLRRPQFLLRTLVLLIAVAALALFAEVTRRRSKPKSLAGPPSVTRGALRIARLRHAGDWNISPHAIPNLMNALQEPPFSYEVRIAQRDIFASDPDLIYYPLIYIHGSGAFSLPREDLDALRHHLEANSTLFADAACGSRAFDAAFRRFAAKVLPNHRLGPIPRTDELYHLDLYGGFDLRDCQYNEAAGGAKDFPRLEGVKINGHWAIIYSKYGIGCVLEREHDGNCKGYMRDDAVRIGGNVVMYSTLP